MIKIHIFTDKRNDKRKMQIHTYKKGVHVSSSNVMPFDEHTIGLYSRGHKVVELVNVAHARDLKLNIVNV